MITHYECQYGIFVKKNMKYNKIPLILLAWGQTCQIIKPSGLSDDIYTNLNLRANIWLLLLHLVSATNQRSI